MSKLFDVSKQVNENIFSLYLDEIKWENDIYKPSIQFGSFDKKYIYKEDVNSIKWIKVEDEPDEPSLYYLWGFEP